MINYTSTKLREKETFKQGYFWFCFFQTGKDTFHFLMLGLKCVCFQGAPFLRIKLLRMLTLLAQALLGGIQGQSFVCSTSSDSRRGAF